MKYNISQKIITGKCNSNKQCCFQLFQHIFSSSDKWGYKIFKITFFPHANEKRNAARNVEQKQTVIACVQREFQRSVPPPWREGEDNSDLVTGPMHYNTVNQQTLIL